MQKACVNVFKSNKVNCDLRFFTVKLLQRLNQHIISKEALFEWMIKYKFNVRGSFILQILLNKEWVDSDIDFHGSETTSIGTSEEVLKNVFIGSISYTSRILSTCNDGKLSKSYNFNRF